MTRQNYQALATIFAMHEPREARPQTNARELWETLLDEITRELKRDNYRFDRERFYDAIEEESLRLDERIGNQ